MATKAWRSRASRKGGLGAFRGASGEEVLSTRAPWGCLPAPWGEVSPTQAIPKQFAEDPRRLRWPGIFVMQWLSPNFPHGPADPQFQHNPFPTDTGRLVKPQGGRLKNRRSLNKESWKATRSAKSRLENTTFCEGGSLNRQFPEAGQLGKSGSPKSLGRRTPGLRKGERENIGSPLSGWRAGLGGKRAGGGWPKPRGARCAEGDGGK